MDLNRATLIGNVTRDPELRTTPAGQNVASFGIATNQMWTDAQGQKQKRAEFHNVVAWGKLADICKQYLVKGKKVYLEGRLQTREWEAQDGQKKTRTEIIAENMIMLDRGNAPASAAAAPQAPGVAEEPSRASMQHPPNNEEIRIEDIPF